MSKNFTINFVLIVLTVLCCTQDLSAARVGRRIDCSKRVNRAIERFNKRRFNDTKTILTEAKYQCSGHSAMDTILYYLGKANINLKAPMEARVEFERLIQDFPSSVFSEEARFLLGYCDFLDSSPPEKDQTKTHEAIQQLNGFIDRFPESVYADSAKKYVNECFEKLASKEYANAHFYEKTEKYEAAIIYYKYFIEEFPSSKLVNQARLALANSLASVSRYQEAKAVLDELLSVNPGEDIAKKARLLKSRLDKPEEYRVLDKRARRKRRRAESVDEGKEEKGPPENP